MKTAMRNRGPMTEEQRRAMFWRLHHGGGGGVPRESSAPASSSSSGGSTPTIPQIPTIGTSGGGNFQSLETTTTPSARKKKSSGNSSASGGQILSDAEREQLWNKLRQGATDTRTLPPRSELSDAKLIEIDKTNTEQLDALQRAIDSYRSTSMIDQAETKFIHAAGDISGGIASVVDPFEKLFGDPTTNGPLTKALQSFDSFVHTRVPDVAPKGTLPTLSGIAGGSLPYISGAELLGSMSWFERAISSMGKFGDVISSWKTPVMSAFASWRIGKYRENHPTMDPKTEKVLAIAQQISGYVSAITGITSGKKTIGTLAPKTTSKTSQLLSDLGEAATLSGKTLAENVPASVRAAFGKLYKFHSALSDITSSTWTALTQIPYIARSLKRAAKLRDEADIIKRNATRNAKTVADDVKAMADKLRADADAMLAREEAQAQREWEQAVETSAQALKIRSGATLTEAERKYAATLILDASHKGALARWNSAKRMYDEGAHKWYSTDAAAADSRSLANELDAVAQQQIETSLRVQKTATQTYRRMYEKAASLEADHAAGASATAATRAEDAVARSAEADALTKQAHKNLTRAIVVAGGATAQQLIEEARIESAQNDMTDAWLHGDNYIVPPTQPRSALGTAEAAGIGLLGLPAIRQTRYGQDQYIAQVANYRAKYEAIARAENAGEISAAEADQMRRDLAANDKPMNMAGKGPWTFAPAAAALLSWKAQQLADTLSRTSIDTVKPGSYMDGDTVNLTEHSGPNSIRLLDINAPEVAHPEFGKMEELFGKAAADYARSLLPDGQTVRVVLDSHKKAAGKEVHGRQLASLETLPAPFDKLLSIPGIGKLIPANEFQTEMIKAGLADIHYRELSGPTDRQNEHDAARAIAQLAGNNIWSQDGRDALPWVGKEKTLAQVIEAMNARRARAADNAGLPPPPIPPTTDLNTTDILPEILMLGGNSGAFRTLGDPGQMLAKLLHAAASTEGAMKFNLQAAEHPDPVVYRPPKGIKTDYEKHAETVLKKRKSKKYKSVVDNNNVVP